jgi:choline dehydrogenase
VPVFDLSSFAPGPQGCVIANRLSANPRLHVMLIEADTSRLIHMSKGHLRTHRDPHLTWYFPVTADEDRRGWQGSLIGGKVLGSSSSINSMLYIRGQPRDYND